MRRAPVAWTMLGSGLGLRVRFIRYVARIDSAHP